MSAAAGAGIGLRAAHYADLVEWRPPIGWVEVHAENYFGAGGPPHHWLEQARAHYPLSLHGVGLSLGSTDPLCLAHVDALRRLVDRYAPALVSDHLCWCSVDGVYFNDLLPLPYTEEALAHVAERVARVQDRLGRRILIENVSAYLRFAHSTMPEWTFLSEVAARADCLILLDVNNVHVSARNVGFDPREYLDAIDGERVAEIHVAGFAANRVGEDVMLIDHHGSRVSPSVWVLLERVLSRIGPRPVLIERDAALPPLRALVEEARFADRLLGGRHELAA